MNLSGEEGCRFDHGRVGARPPPRQGTRYRRLDPSRQALLALAHLRNGDTPARLASGFAIGATTAWRYIKEAVDLLAAQAPNIEPAMHRIANLAYAILDGTLIRIDRLTGPQDRRHYAGNTAATEFNAQVIADPAGRLAWISPALPGSTHDLTAARTHRIIDALTNAEVMTFADKGYRGARGSVRTPFYGRNLPEHMREVNRSHARIRAIGERAIATLKCWKLLAKLHCCPRRATALLAAIFVLQLIEEQRHSG